MLLAGNHGLLRLLPSVYPHCHEAVQHRLDSLMRLTNAADANDLAALKQLLLAIADDHPMVGGVWPDFAQCSANRNSCAVASVGCRERMYSLSLS